MVKMRAFPVYLLLVGADSVSRYTMFILLSAYYVLIVHMSPLQLVLVGTALEASYFLCQIPTGVFADTHSRKLAVVIGVGFTGLCLVAEGLFPFFAAIIAAEIARGVAEAFFDGADNAWLADELGEARYGQALLRGGQIGQAGAIAGTIAGVALGSIHLNLPVVAGGVAMIGLSCFLAVTMPENGFRPAPHPEVSRFRAMRRTLGHGLLTIRRYPVLLAVVLAELFVGAASEGFDRLWEAHLLRDIHLPSIGELEPIIWFGIIAIAMSLVSIVTAQVFRRRLDAVTGAGTQRVSTTARLLVALQLFSIAVIVVFALAGNLALAIAALLTSSAVGAMRRPVKSVWINQNIPKPEIRATVLSVIGGSNAIGQVAGGPPVGVIGNVFSLRTAIAATGLIMAPVLFIYGRAGRKGLQAMDQSEVADQSQIASQKSQAVRS